MEKDGEKYCDSCGQKIPKMAKLASQENGKHLCLACSIREAQISKGLRH
jgi:formylmethanofuran dehydrogenase subunit E